MDITYCMVFLGYNNMLTHKRGVENVIHFQSLASPFAVNYYLHWDRQTRVSRFDNLICIGIKKNLFWFVTLNLLLFQLKKRNKRMFLHSHNPLMSLMSIFQSHLFTVHDGLYYLMSSTKHRLQIVFWLLEKLLYWRCSFVHFISDYTKQMSLFNKKKNFIIVPNTSHFESFKLKEFAIDAPSEKFRNGVAKVFTVRSIEERALINLIIDVAARLQNVGFEFVIAGKGPLLESYRENIKMLGLKNITLLGYVSDNDLIQYYKNCDVVLVPAAYGEGFGLPIIEGYLYDKPVIASNVCAIPEVIISKDFLFENTVDSVVSKLYFAIDQNQTQFQYRNYYNDRFSNLIVMSKMNKLYKKLF